MMARGPVWTAVESALVVSAAIAVTEVFRTSDVGAFGELLLVDMLPLLGLACLYAAFRAGFVAGAVAAVICTAYALWVPGVRGDEAGLTGIAASIFLLTTLSGVALVGALRRRVVVERARTQAEAARGRRWEELLRRMRLVRQVIADAQPEGLLVLSASGRVVLMNRVLAGMAGAEPEAVADQPWTEVRLRVAGAFRNPGLLDAVVTTDGPVLKAADLELAASPGGSVAVRAVLPDEGGLDPAVGRLFLFGGPGRGGVQMAHRITALAVEAEMLRPGALEGVDLLARLVDGVETAHPEPVDLVAALGPLVQDAGLAPGVLTAASGARWVWTDPVLLGRLVALLLRGAGLPLDRPAVVLVVDTGRSVRLAVRFDHGAVPAPVLEAVERDFHTDPLPLAGAGWLELHLARGLAALLDTRLRVEQPAAGGVSLILDLPPAGSTATA